MRLPRFSGHRLGNVSWFMRHVLVLLAAAPILLAALTVVHAGAPCPHSHSHNSPMDRSSCPCCDKMLRTTSAPCISCQIGIEARAGILRTANDARRISFETYDEPGEGLAIEPPLPPPRSMGVV